MAGCRQTLGETHLDTLSAVSNLAMLLQEMGELQAARPLHEQTVAGCRATLGARDAQTISATMALAMLLQAGGACGWREGVAGGGWRVAGGGWRVAVGCGGWRVVQGQGRRTPAPPRPSTRPSCLAQEMSDPAEAEPLYLEAVGALTAELGARHPETLTAKNNLATLLTATGRRDEAVALLRDTLCGRRESLGPAHPQTLTAMTNLASVLYDEACHNLTHTHHPPPLPRAVHSLSLFSLFSLLSLLSFLSCTAGRARLARPV